MRSTELNKLVTLASLAAIGAVLMVFIELPYLLAPWLKIEFSDVVVLIAFSLFGFKSALLVGGVKVLADYLYQGASGPFGIGQITALIATISYVLLLHLVKLNFKEDNWLKVLGKCIVVLLSITAIMTLANYLFITPIYTGELFWFQMSDGSALGYDGSYILGVISIYVPFNLIKGSLILASYYLIAPRIFVIASTTNILKK